MLFEATVAKFGMNINTSETTILLINIKERTFESVQFNHTWCYATKRFNEKNLLQGEIILLEAIVKPYRKGKNKLIIDYGLDRPRKIKSIGFDKKPETKKLTRKIPLKELT